MTKEQLTKENGALRDNVQTWSNKDATLRKEFARVLGKVENKYGYSNSTPKDLSWNEIFCEIGKLIQFQNLDRLERRLSCLEDRIAPATIKAEDVFAK